MSSNVGPDLVDLITEWRERRDAALEADETGYAEALSRSIEEAEQLIADNI